MIEPNDEPTGPSLNVGSFFSALVISASLVPFGLIVLTFFARYLFAAELVGNFRLQLFLALAPFPILLWVLGRWRWATVLTAVTIWLGLNLAWVYFPVKQPPAGTQRLKIMSFNVLGNNFNDGAVRKRIRDEDPDVLVILEYANQWTTALKQTEKKYPYQIKEPRWHGFGIALFSKFPLSDSQVLLLTKDETDNPAIVTKVTAGQTKIRLAAIHVLSPTNIVRLRLRNEQLEELSDFLVDDKLPTIVMGDFNGTPWSPFLSDFMKTTGYRDSRQGFGYQASWHATIWPLLIPIDHAFVSPDIHVHDRHLGRYAGSDHLPLVFEVSVAE